MTSFRPVGAGSERSAIVAHTLPFGAWILLMHFLDIPQIPPAWAYAIRSLICAVLFLALRPWRFYPPVTWHHWPLALTVGLGVFVIWVAMEHPRAALLGPLQELYIRWGILPLGELRPPLGASPYAPETCGWPLTVARIAGSGLVIGVIEEFFWRGFLYRWLIGGDFRAIDPARFARGPFWATAALFALEHREWLAGFAAGALYGWLFIRSRDIWTVAIAHAVTNLVLGAYVVATGAYQFW